MTRLTRSCNEYTGKTQLTSPGVTTLQFFGAADDVSMEETLMVGRQRRGSLMVEVKERVAVLGVGQT